MKPVILAATVMAPLFFLSVAPASADVLAAWTFDNNPPTTAGPIAADSGIMATGSSASRGYPGASAPAIYNVTNTGNCGDGSSNCYGSTSWNVNGTNYWQFQTSSTGYGQLQLTFDQVSSSTGPNAFVLEYSTDGSDFTTFINTVADGTHTVTDTNGLYAVNPNTASAAWAAASENPNDIYRFDLSSIPGLNDASAVYLRLAVDASYQAGNSSKNVSSGGYNFIDNVQISGTSLTTAVPEPASLSIAAVGVFALLARRSKRLPA